MLAVAGESPWSSDLGVGAGQNFLSVLGRIGQTNGLHVAPLCEFLQGCNLYTERRTAVDDFLHSMKASAARDTKMVGEYPRRLRPEDRAFPEVINVRFSLLQSVNRFTYLQLFIQTN